ncbi:PREDICTED: anaphase-promoting complex subunit 1 [Propithecus coquereli]|uniref:anaphase-promoting complex subunit 1 n=1 Tax=Propithecus coquereli TaxID=379532 RepID=UPI00063F06FC|nr:PREDICTED: anaphase-promoting complex subunit 1 [Propithecus coquereli]
MSNFYEERATMIAAGDLQEFVPFGRDHCKHHPNALNLQLRQLQPASELWSSDGAAGLVGSLQEVTIHEKQKESWQLRKGVSEIGEEADYDEELYVAGNMVIWSKGSKSQALAVYKAFTVDSPVQQALWCDFIISQDKSEKAHYSSYEVEKCICILQSSCINIHSIEGKDYIASLPFQVANVWPTKYGLLFERSSSSHEVPPGPPREPLPTMFSMLHPLDEITPLVCKSGSLFGSSRVQYVVDPAMKIVFLNIDPSIVMTYDAVQNVHSVWTLRRVKSEEENAVLKFSDQGGTPQNAATSSSLTAHLRSLSKGDSPVTSPFQNYSSIHSQSRSASSPSLHSRSPSISNMAALSRAHSPALGVHSFSGVQRFNLSSHNQSPRRHSISHSPNSNSNGSFLAPETEPIVPELCIDHLWTETITNTREKNSQASKVFITSDLCGQKFLCFLVESQLQLRCKVTGKSLADGFSAALADCATRLGARTSKAEFFLVVLLSPVPELRDSSKLHDSLYNEDCTFQQLGTYIHSIRDPVHNRVTLDWEYLLNSDYHQNVESHLLNRSLCLSPSEVSRMKDEGISQNLSLDSSTLLFTHIPAIFFVLHLVYEELKLNTLMGEGICSLVDLLVQLSIALYILGDESSVSDEASQYLSRITVGFTLRDLETLPFGIALPIRDAIYHCREQPASDWPEAVCLLIGRQDLSKQACEGNLPRGKSVLSSDVPSGTETEEEDDGMNDMNHEVMSLIWSEDLRVQDVRRLLQSAHPVRVNVVQYPELSDHEFIEEKENRSIADWLRAPDTMYLLDFVKPEFLLLRHKFAKDFMTYLSAPNASVGRAPPRNTTVDLNSGNIDVPPNMTSWASFHNGVAAGLKIAPASQIDSAWIVYNKPKHAELANEYAGFLMALGLNGHLTKLATLNIHDYLTKGTMDMSITRLLSIHIPALLPPTSTELDVPHNVQVAAVVGIGLVYQGTAHRHTAEVLLAEIGMGLIVLNLYRYSLSTSNSSIAALLCALYPHFPAHSTDNRYHLQALRHLYVLAAEPRLLVPVDVDTNMPCYALLEVTYKGTQWYEQTKEELMAPTLLPELHLLKQIKVKGPRYWELLIDLSKGMQHLKSILSKDGVLYVKLRAGQLSYKEDPMGWQSLLAQTVANRNSEARAFKVIRRLGRREMSETSELWQIKLVLEFFSSRSHQERLQNHPKRGLFMNSEFLPVVKCTIDNTLDQWLQAGGDMCVHAYLSGQPFEESQLSMLACFLVYHSVPAPRHLLAVGLEGSTSFAELLFKFKQLKMPVRALLRLAPLLLGNPQPMVM